MEFDSVRNSSPASVRNSLIFLLYNKVLENALYHLNLLSNCSCDYPHLTRRNIELAHYYHSCDGNQIM